MIDMDLAELYGVETKVLKQSVRRNKKRFPDDFMFELTKKELGNLRSQIVTSSWGGTRYTPMAFTEQGVAMLSSILNSDRAIHVNIQIIRTFIQLRKMFSSHEELERKIKDMEKKYDEQFKIVFAAFEEIKQLFSEEQESIREIGFKHDNDKQQ